MTSTYIWWIHRTKQGGVLDFCWARLSLLQKKSVGAIYLNVCAMFFCKISFLFGCRNSPFQPIGKSSCHLARLKTQSAFNSPGSDYDFPGPFRRHMKRFFILVVEEASHAVSKFF
ncbi:hypothetical protein VPH35_037880 [Triticum aestivum]